MKKVNTLLLALILCFSVDAYCKNSNTLSESSLVSFESHINGDKVEITWETINQSNVEFFTIEKSKDGINFEQIFEVQASAKSLAYADYFNVDFDVWEGKMFYRITEKDNQGNSLKSNIVAVAHNKTRKTTEITERTVSFDGLYDNSAAFDNEALVVVRNRKGDELYSNVQITGKSGNAFMGYDEEQYIPEGKYLVVGTSDDRLFGKKLRVTKL